MRVATHGLRWLRRRQLYRRSTPAGRPDAESDAGSYASSRRQRSSPPNPRRSPYWRGARRRSKSCGSGAPLTYQWSRNGVPITGATAASYTIPAAVSGDDGAMFTVVVSGASGTATSNAARLTVIPVTPANGVDVVAYKYDTSRTGQNVNESILTTANVNSSTFGLRHFITTDGKVDAQPLYLSQLNVAGAPHNVLFIATEHGSVYAIDTATYAELWKVSLIPAGHSTSDDRACAQITPEIGITSTPTIDRSAGAHGIMYVVAMSKDGSGNYHQILHALDVTTGADVTPPREITATFTDGNGNVTTFEPGQYEERAALLLSNGTIYTEWASHCDVPPYGGWIITYDQATLAQNGVLNVGPGSAVVDGVKSRVTVGPGIWMSGGGPAVDAAGRVFLATGNGPFDTTLNAAGRPANGNYAQSFLKLQLDAGGLQIADYFALYDAVCAVGTGLRSGGRRRPVTAGDDRQQQPAGQPVSGWRQGRPRLHRQPGAARRIQRHQERHSSAGRRSQAAAEYAGLLQQPPVYRRTEQRADVVHVHSGADVRHAELDEPRRSSVIREPRRSSPRTGPPTASFGPPSVIRRRASRSCMLTMRRTSPPSCTTAHRRQAGATLSAPPTGSSRRW